MNKKYNIDLKFHECFTEDGEVTLASAPEELDGLVVEVFDDQYIPDYSEEPVSTGLKQVHIGGTPKALSDLGRFLIAISKTNLPRDFVTHYEPIKGQNNNDSIHLVFHQNLDANLEPSTRVGNTMETDE